MYKGIVKVFHDAKLEGAHPSVSGKLLEVEVMANSRESLVKKINAMLVTLDDE